MINFHYETDFELSGAPDYSKWLTRVIQSEYREEGDVNYIFCDDNYLYNLNIKYLNHNTLTDVISFDSSEGKTISGDIFISIDRVKENAEAYQTIFRDELLRVMAHGLLHCCGYGDKTTNEAAKMRGKEEEKIKMFHVKQSNHNV